MQWFWAIALNFSLIQTFVTLTSPNVDNPITKPPVAVGFSPNPLFLVITSAIAIAVIALTIYIIVKIPSTIVKTSKKIVHSAAENITPIALRIQHKKDTKKNHIKLSSSLILIIKILLIIVPVILSFTSQFLDKQMLDYNIAIGVALWMAGFSLILFAIQYSLSRIFSLPKGELV